MKNYHRLLAAGLVSVTIVGGLSACTSDEQSVTPSDPVVASPIEKASASTGISKSEVTASAQVPMNASAGAEQVIAESKRPPVVVYKSATCGCCKDWVSYLEEEGFTVTAIDHDNVDQIRAENGLTEPGLKSCHTALVDGYVIEGHVPVSDIERLLAERPAVVGLTAPGMPVMSPGMGSRTPEGYDVLAFQKDGRSRVYSSY